LILLVPPPKKRFSHRKGGFTKSSKFSRKQFDKRVVNRFAFVMQRLLSAAAISLPAVFTQKAALKSFYRFIGNQGVSQTGLFLAHSRYTIKQAGEKNGKHLYLLQDTTRLHCNGRGKLSHELHAKGLWHHSLLLDEQSMMWENAAYGKKHQRKQISLAEKEFYKWIAGIRRAVCRSDRSRANSRPGKGHICFHTSCYRAKTAICHPFGAKPQGGRNYRQVCR
jgi:hypothetical protein